MKQQSEFERVAGLTARGQWLWIPTNPNVSPDVNPESRPDGEYEYANPVTVNNRLVLFANAVIAAMDELDQGISKVRQAKLQKKTAERQLRNYEQRILRSFPPPKGKNAIKLIDAHIARAAHELDDTLEQYQELQEALDEAEDAVTRAEGRVEKLRQWLKAIELAIQACTTHLSYVKFDGAFQGRRG